MSRIQFSHRYEDIISLENLLQAWGEFMVGKKQRADVQEFETNLMGNIIALHGDLVTKRYVHSRYTPFNISDPKPRSIHKAVVRDRLLHHAIHRLLYPFFDRTFIADSFSCRVGKGTHRAMNRFRNFAYQVSHNHTRTVWVLKCDIRKFFASIDQTILLATLNSYISDPDIIWLLVQIISSFHSGTSGIGLPLGNLTSQLLVNIYMNQFDQFVKHRLKVRHYVRYADDFVFLSHDKDFLLELLPKVGDFLIEELHLNLHPQKISLRTLASGVDFLGWVHFPDHRVLRIVTKRRMIAGIENSRGKREIVQSYLGLAQHGNTSKLQQKVMRAVSAEG